MLIHKYHGNDPKQIILENIKTSFLINIEEGAEISPEKIQVKYTPYRNSNAKEISFYLKDFDQHVASLTDDYEKEALLFLCPESDRRRWTEEALRQAQAAKAKREAEQPIDLESYIKGMEKASDLISDMGHDSGDEYDIAIRSMERMLDEHIAELRKKLHREKM